jgi:hypothetical protein
VGFIAEDPDTLQEAYLGTRTARPESFTFIGPAANALELLQFWTDKAARLNFGVAVLARYAGWIFRLTLFLRSDSIGRVLPRLPTCAITSPADV